MNLLEIKVEKYDIIEDSIQACVSKVFINYNCKEDSEIIFLKKVCFCERIRILYVNINDDDTTAQFISGSESGGIYKITKFKNKYYFDWKIYKTVKSRNVIMIPIFVSKCGTIRNMFIFDKLTGEGTIEKNISNLGPVRLNNKNINNFLENLKAIEKFVKKNDTIVGSRTSSNRNEYINAQYRNYKKNFVLKKHVMSLPYVRYRWIKFISKYNKYLEHEEISFRDLKIRSINNFVDVHDRLPSPFSKNICEKKLGSKLFKYLNGDEYLKLKTLKNIPIVKDKFDTKFFTDNLKIIFDNIQIDRLWIKSLKDKMEKEFSYWVEHSKKISDPLTPKEKQMWKYVKTHIIESKFSNILDVIPELEFLFDETIKDVDQLIDVLESQIDGVIPDFEVIFNDTYLLDLNSKIDPPKKRKFSSDDLYRPSKKARYS